MKNAFIKKILVLSLLSGSLASIAYSADLTFDSFEEAEKAAEQREAEYNRRMQEQVSKVDGAWEKQKSDIGEGSLDITKITETRNTEMTSENEQNTQLQQSVTDSINGLKQQMVSSVNANTVGFAGASAAYSWSVKCKNGKYILSDSYDEAFFVSGKSGNTTTTTTSPEADGGSKAADKASDKTDEPAPENANTTSEEPESTPQSGFETEHPSYEAGNPDSPDEKGPQIGDVEKPSDEVAAVNETPVTKSDRVVEITVQHPTTFEEATFTVTEGQENNVFKLDKFSIPEDTRVKISAKANMEVENTTLTMTIVDDEGESEPIDSASMKNYRHLFRIPANEGYSANIYVNENGKEPRKIMQLCIPVAAVDFDTRTISR